jgi:beta-lactamase class A
MLKSFIIKMFLAISCIGVNLPASADIQPFKLNSISIQKKLAKLEADSGGRLGISAVNTANNVHIQYRAQERFPMGCTSKVVVVSAILKASMTDSSLLQQKITYTQKDVDLAGWSPITQQSQYLTEGITIGQLCGAAIMQSDNAAMNILMDKLGGLNVANSFLRSLGDNTSQFDRGWPAEASSIPGDLRDTSTPAAMAKTFQLLVLGDALASQQREQLQVWLQNNAIGNTIGKARIRGGAPKNWLVGDKTGTGNYGTTNDIAVIWPPNCQPIIIAIYFTQSKKDAPLREDVLASATKMIINEFAHSDQCIQAQLSKLSD